MNSRTVRVGVVLMTLLWVVLALWAVGPVMRESDQASLLQGAVSLAREPGNCVGNSSYNYDKQYFSYWVVAAWLRLRGAAGTDSSLETVVREGNLVAVGLCALALLLLVGTQRNWSWGSALVLGCILFAPVVAFTGVLLSPNLISAAFLFFLIAALRQGSRDRDGDEGSGFSIWLLAGVAFLAWAATAARQDIVLVMPLLALLAAKGKTLRELCFDRTVWALACGCVAAIAIGYLVSATHTRLPAPFFTIKTFVPYLAGGLGALLLPLGLFSWKGVRSAGGYGWALAGAVLIPLLFYSCFLYTPRHLLVVALALSATVFLTRGREIWDSLKASKADRVILILALFGTALPWIVGARMSGWSSGHPVVASSTLYPTTDGFWPLGAYGWFFGRLAHAADRPLDHNQQVWLAWTRIDPARIPEGRCRVVSNGLAPYGRLFLESSGRSGGAGLEEADFVLFDDRTLAKKQHYGGVDNRSVATSLLSRGAVREVGSAAGRRILLWTRDAEQMSKETSVSVTLALAEHFGGNDFRVARWAEKSWREEYFVGHRAVLALRVLEGNTLLGLRELLPGMEKPVRLTSSYDEDPWWIVPLSGPHLQVLEEKGGPELEAAWIGIGSLPAFMDVRKYSD